jgi:hypothetical protein
VRAYTRFFFYTKPFGFAYNNTATVQCIIKLDFSQKSDDHVDSNNIISLSVYVYTYPIEYNNRYRDYTTIILYCYIMLLYGQGELAKNGAREQNNNINIYIYILLGGTYTATDVVVRTVHNIVSAVVCVHLVNIILLYYAVTAYHSEFNT